MVYNPLGNYKQDPNIGHMVKLNCLVGPEVPPLSDLWLGGRAVWW